MRHRRGEVTQRKEAEARSRETEERHQALLTRSPNAVYLCDIEGRFLDANPAALDLLGYTSEDIRLLDFSSLLTTSEDLVRARDSIRNLVHIGADKEISEYKLKRKDGEFIWVEVLSSLVQKDGQPIAIQGIVRDVTERKQAAAALAVSEAQFRVIFEQAAIGLAIVNFDDGRFQRCNEALAQILGYTTEELCQLTVAEVSHADDYTRDWELGHQMLDSNLSRYQVEKRYRRKDGEWIWALLTATLVRNEDETPRFLIGMLEDVSERRQTEERLRASEEKFRALVENSLDGIILLDHDGKISYASPAMTRILGYEVDGIVGLNPFSLIHPEDVAYARDRFTAVLAQDAKPILAELRVRHKDGTWRWLEFLRSTWGDDASRRAMVLNYRDVTEIREADRQRKRLAAAVEQSADSIVITDRDGRIQYVNPAFERISGYTRAETIGQKTSLLKSGE